MYLGPDVRFRRWIIPRPASAYGSRSSGSAASVRGLTSQSERLQPPAGGRRSKRQRASSALQMCMNCRDAEARPRGFEPLTFGSVDRRGSARFGSSKPYSGTRCAKKAPENQNRRPVDRRQLPLRVGTLAPGGERAQGPRQLRRLPLVLGGRLSPRPLDARRSFGSGPRGRRSFDPELVEQGAERGWCW